MLKSLQQEVVQWKPERIMVRSFLLSILVGTFLLALPVSNTSGKWLDPLSALFTSTSAVCVTGLTVVDTGTTFTPLGQNVVLILIQIGGLQIMTFGTLYLYLLGWRPTIRSEFVMMEALGHENMRELRPLVTRTIAFTLLLEAMGAAVIAWRLHTGHAYDLSKALYHGVFHSVSAFCNAGFALYPDNLVGLRSDSVLMLTVAVLIVLGGLGFVVMFNLSSLHLWRRDRLKRGRLTLHSQIVLQATGVLIVIGAAAFLVLEWHNTLRDLPVHDKVACAVFQSVTPRTAGFNVVDMSECRPPTIFGTMFLMAIGGSPSSTAGGIKTTTAVLLILTVATFIRGREETECKGRAVPHRIIREALSIFVLYLTWMVTAFAVLLLSERLPPTVGTVSSADALLFEVISAIGTVGLSTGITADLSVVGKLCLTLCMFVGRVGPLALAVFVGTREMGQATRFPEENVIVG
jgi:trk system potassium uptake protein TrkH